MFIKIWKILRTSVSTPLIWAFIFGALTLLLSFISLVIEGNYTWGVKYFGEGFKVFTNLLFNSVQLLIMREPNPIPSNIIYVIARFFAVIYATVGIIGFIWEMSTRFRDFLWECYFLMFTKQSPAIVIGLGRIGLPLAKEIREKQNKRVYAITFKDKSENIKKARRDGILVIEGNAADSELQDRIPIKPGSEIFIATGDDSNNLDIAGGILNNLSNQDHPGKNSPIITCYIHVSTNKTRNTIKAHNLLNSQEQNIEFTLFSTPDTMARNLFNQLFLDQNLGIISEPKSDSRSDKDDSESEENQASEIFKLPGKNEVFHLFIFGFNEIGQTVARHAARFAHFESCLRPRITIFDEFGDNKAWEIFTDQYSAFSPRGLNLSSEKFLNGGDGWETRHFRPSDPVYRTRKNRQEDVPKINRRKMPNESPSEHRQRIKFQEADQEFCILQNHAVEYATHAEYMPILTDVESSKLLDEIVVRLACNKPRVRAAFIFCFEDERRNFNDALRIQQELARRCFKKDDNSDKLKCCNDMQELQFPIPFFMYLPVEKGLIKLLDSTAARTSQQLNKKLPILPFGDQTKSSSYEIITNSEIKNYSEGLQQIHKILSGKSSASHTDFESSNMEAAMFAEVKLKALGITFKKPEDAPNLKAIFDDYYTDEVKELYEEWSKPHPDNEIEDRHKHSIDLPYSKFKDIINSFEQGESTERMLLERLTLLQQVSVSQNTDIMDEDPNNISQLKSIVVKSAICRFKSYLKLAGAEGSDKRDLDAKIEHNRWMGERLSKNWKFGRRDNHRRQRISFVPWKFVPQWDENLKDELYSRYDNLEEWKLYEPEEMKDYDRQQLPRIILARREQGWCAYVNNTQ